MRILFIGDIVGRSGRAVVLERLPGLVRDWKLDFVAINGENAAGGFGITEAIYQDLIDAGADVITGGNHSWDQREALVFIERAPRLLRPINYPPGTPGRGVAFLEAKNGARVLVANAMGRIFMEALDDPFAAVDRELTAVVQRKANSVEARFRGEPISKSVVSRLFFPKGRELKHTDRFEMPNISRVDYDFGPDRHFIITSQCTPIAEFETEVYTVMTFRFGFIGALVRILFEPLSRHIIRQDVDVLRAQTRQIRRFEGPRFSHVETDLLGLKIHALRRCAERNELPGKEEEKPREVTICF